MYPMNTVLYFLVDGLYLEDCSIRDILLSCIDG